jgi:hypothetical protein
MIFLFVSSLFQYITYNEYKEIRRFLLDSGGQQCYYYACPGAISSVG